MSKIFVITSGKGGVGKTTTTANLGVGLAMRGQKVALIDTDTGLRNLDLLLGLENRIMYDLIDVTEGRVPYKKALVRHKKYETLFLLPTSQVKDKMAVKPEQQKQAAPPQPAVQEMVVVNRTLRGGQEIKTPSSVLVCGNVNPGAQIIAGGSIDIRGTCRGLVHAGAYGDTSAFVIADHLMPTQIRIADIIARSPDKQEKTERAERASLKDGKIVIEPIER